MPIILRVVLDERIHGTTVGGEVGNHIRLGHDDLSVQYVVVGVVAMVHHKGEVHHESGRVAFVIGAGVGLVGGQAVVGEEFVLTLTVDDDSPAGAFHLRGEVYPSADEVNLLILKRVRVDGERKRRNGPVGVVGILLATVQSSQECY